MAGEIPAGAITTPDPGITIKIVVPPILLDYSGTKEFLKDLPAILAELQKFLPKEVGQPT